MLPEREVTRAIYRPRRSLGGAPLNINETRALLRLLTVLCDGGDAALAQAARAAAAKGKVGCMWIQHLHIKFVL